MSSTTFRLALCFGLAASGAFAQSGYEVNLYSGWQTAPHSDVDGVDENGDPFSFTAGWEGRPLEPPPYYGLRVTRWQDSGWGLGLEFTHAKIYADGETLDESGFSQLEFTDGHNIVTLNAARRIDLSERWSTHAGLGLGLALPYTEVTTPTGTTTEEYQLTGPAVRWFAGLSYDLTDRWSVYGEYGGTYSQNEADLEGGGSISTDVLTNAVNLGVGFSF